MAEKSEPQPAPSTGRSHTLKAGETVAGRDVDLSYQLAKQFSLEHQGVGSLIMEVL